MIPPELPPRSSTLHAAHGLDPAQRELRVDEFFLSFPWVPTAQVVLGQWESRSFFDRFVR